MVKTLLAACALVALALGVAPVAWAAPEPPPLSEQTEECLGCHESDTPGIVADWKASRHARMTPQAALALPERERRMSVADVPAPLRTVAVGCFECHGQRAEAHADSYEHNEFRIHTVVSPNDCRTCHPVEAEQYAGSKKAYAVGNLEQNPVYSTLVETVTKGVRGKHGPPPPAALDVNRSRSCFGCHGTRVEMRGLKTVVSAGGDEVQVPVLTRWPNQGVGRINPDGSRGACTACHPRHSFSIEVARSPHTCAQCHMEPDVPAWNVYAESKHGNIFQARGNGWDWSAVPWVVGRDFTAPTCAACHNSLLTTEDGTVVAERTHDFGARLWVRIFGLIYSHPQPERGNTWILRNADGQPLPTTFGGKPAAEGLLSPAGQQERRATMKRVCQACHGTSWAEGHLAQLDETLLETDAAVAAATRLMQQAWARKLADPANPFDEPLERIWVQHWLFNANSVRYAAAMGGPSYAAFEHGWWELSGNLAELHEAVEGR
jgi:hypothetical protein